MIDFRDCGKWMDGARASDAELYTGLRYGTGQYLVSTDPRYRWVGRSLTDGGGVWRFNLLIAGKLHRRLVCMEHAPDKGPMHGLVGVSADLPPLPDAPVHRSHFPLIADLVWGGNYRDHRTLSGQWYTRVVDHARPLCYPSLLWAVACAVEQEPAVPCPETLHRLLYGTVAFERRRRYDLMRNALRGGPVVQSQWLVARTGVLAQQRLALN